MVDFDSIHHFTGLVWRDGFPEHPDNQALTTKRSYVWFLGQIGPPTRMNTRSGPLSWLRVASRITLDVFARGRFGKLERPVKNDARGRDTLIQILPRGRSILHPLC